MGEKFSVDPYDLIRGKRILGSWGGETDPDKDIPKYADWYMRGELDLTKLISHKYGLEDVNQALEDLESGRVARAVLEFKQS
jgi:S-(hydroxymethyl)glutathione dehydrogenase/alcohol dehydrogenase